MLPRLKKAHRVTNPNRNPTPVLIRPRSSSEKPRNIPSGRKSTNFKEVFSPTNRGSNNQKLQTMFEKVNQDEEYLFMKLMEDLIKGK